jgi:hypothetical protein
MVEETWDETTKEAEATAVAAVVKAMKGLKGPSIARVLGSASVLLEVTPPTAAQGNRGAGGIHAPASGQAVADMTWKDFGELRDAANPSTDNDKVLLAAFWEQMHTAEGKKGNAFQAQPVNSLLKNNGFGFANITEKLEALKTRKPPPIIQLEKKGTSKQARKTYRVTPVGVKRVAAMLSGES